MAEPIDQDLWLRIRNRVKKRFSRKGISATSKELDVETTREYYREQELSEAIRKARTERPVIPQGQIEKTLEAQRRKELGISDQESEQAETRDNIAFWVELAKPLGIPTEPRGKGQLFQEPEIYPEDYPDAPKISERFIPKMGVDYENKEAVDELVKRSEEKNRGLSPEQVAQIELKKRKGSGLKIW